MYGTFAFLAVPEYENSSHGGQLGAAVRKYKMQDGDQFLTILIPDTKNPEQQPVKKPSAWQMLKLIGMTIIGMQKITQDVITEKVKEGFDKVDEKLGEYQNSEKQKKSSCGCN